MPGRSAGINVCFAERTELPPTSPSMSGLGAALEFSREGGKGSEHPQSLGPFIGLQRLKVPWFAGRAPAGPLLVLLG